MPSDTHPIERASVEQADREAAASFLQDYAGGLTHTVRKNMLAGEADWSKPVQAFARHRQQARDAGFAGGVERAKEVADASAASCEKFMKGIGTSASVERGRHRAAREIAAAIRALSAEANEGRCDGK